MHRILAAFFLSGWLFAATTRGDEPAIDTSRGDTMLADYFQAETARLADRCLADIHTLEDWTSRRDEYRRQLAEMLGLDPMPERGDLKPVVTGRLENEFFTVENVHFQSLPGLYVTGNLYLPKNVDRPAPAVLYVCGHSQVKKDGVSLGNKTYYQYHGGWFARNGFVCLTIDTIQLGEIEGLHHGTYREGMWWWNSRGYTPAGVEAFNGIRALDYLQTRPEVDGQRLGVTGRSGGGAYSWWIAALDDRVKAAVPVAGITDLQNHVVDGCVEGHCDCMFMVNTYRWDYPQVVALVAPRALLIGNSDKDTIFPLDGVERLHAKVRRIYRLYGADDKLGLQISEGPHKDTQELQVAAFHWFNRFLKGEDPPVENTGISYFEPEQLRVFRDELPTDQINTRIHELFVAAAPPPAVPETQEAWNEQRGIWLRALKEKCFRGWPEEPGPLNVEKVISAEREGWVLEAYDFDSQPGVRLRVYLWHDATLKGPSSLHIFIGDQIASASARTLHWVFCTELAGSGIPKPPDDPPGGSTIDSLAIEGAFVPRGLGPTAWDQSEKKQIQNRRRFMLLGQTLATMQAWDIRRALQAIRSLAAYKDAPITVFPGRAVNMPALYAALFSDAPLLLNLGHPPKTHRDGPDFLNVLRYLDVPQAAAMAAARGKVIVNQTGLDGWDYPLSAAECLRWPFDRFNVADISALVVLPGAASQVMESEQEIKLVTPELEAVVRKKGYVTGIAAGSLVDKKTGFRDAGFGLDIVDWIMEPGSDEAYRNQLPKEMVYQFDNAYHGKTPKRSLEGPQICTQAKELEPRVIHGKDFVAVQQSFQYKTAALGKKIGSRWSQTIVFPAGKRFFISSDRIDAVNSSPAMFLRVDMPGHIKHQHGDTFSEVYLSYVGRIPASEFENDFPPDARFTYRRDEAKIPRRMIRAYHLRDAKTGRDGPWLAGMTLNAADVSEAWCHQRGYVCLIEEFGGRPIEAGQAFSAAFIVGYFDSIDEIERVYDEYAGRSGLEATAEGWKLTKSPGQVSQ